MKLRIAVVAGVAAVLAGVALGQTDRTRTNPTPKWVARDEYDADASRLRAQIRELQDQLRILTEQVETMRQSLPVIPRDAKGGNREPPTSGTTPPPIASPDEVKAAIRDGEIIVGMTLDQAARARPKWRKVVKETGENSQRIHFGERFQDEGRNAVSGGVIVTVRGGRISHVVIQRSTSYSVEVTR